MKKFVLAAALASAFTAGAVAQTYGTSNYPPRDDPYGKPMGNNGDTMHQPSSGTITRRTESIPPREEPFGKPMGNDSRRDPDSGTVGRDYNPSGIIPERDEPFGKKMGN